MALAPGTKLAEYEILALIGAGGMGEVYKAHDTKLGRDVAIKVLPDLFAEDPERLARFEREAKLLASLNHDNIATLYGLGELDSIRFLAMELVEGETLAERLDRGTTEFGMGTPLTYGSNSRKITIPQQPQMGIATTVTCAPRPWGH